MLSYDICLFIIKNGIKNFSIARFQIDNIFKIITEVFIRKDKINIIKTKFKIKT